MKTSYSCKHCGAEVGIFTGEKGDLECIDCVVAIRDAEIARLQTELDERTRDMDALSSRLHDERYSPLEQWKQVRDDRDAEREARRSRERELCLRASNASQWGRGNVPMTRDEYARKRGRDCFESEEQ